MLLEAKDRTCPPVASLPQSSQRQTIFGSTGVLFERSVRMGQSPKVVHRIDSKSVASIFRKSSGDPRKSQADRNDDERDEMTHMITPSRLFRVHPTSWAGHRRLV